MVLIIMSKNPEYIGPGHTYSIRPCCITPWPPPHQQIIIKNPILHATEYRPRCMLLLPNQTTVTELQPGSKHAFNICWNLIEALEGSYLPPTKYANLLNAHDPTGEAIFVPDRGCVTHERDVKLGVKGGAIRLYHLSWTLSGHSANDESFGNRDAAMWQLTSARELTGSSLCMLWQVTHFFAASLDCCDLINGYTQFSIWLMDTRSPLHSNRSTNFQFQDSRSRGFWWPMLSNKARSSFIFRWSIYLTV